jgi:hypothetical protein
LPCFLLGRHFKNVNIFHKLLIQNLWKTNIKPLNNEQRAGVETYCGLDGLGFEPQWGTLFTPLHAHPDRLFGIGAGSPFRG